ncbi:MAG TPA: glycosyltransferase family 39 protein, partial [Polyangiaceae bacterium]|nr:glycosyltransferase family 39 protein [Polyangiaceae bacterium]
MPPGQELDSEPRARLPSLLGAIVAGLLLIALMSREGHPGLSVPLGLGLVLAASFGLLYGLGFFTKSEVVGRSVPVRELAAPFATTLASVVALVVALRLAVAGGLPMPLLSSAVLVTSTSLACVFSLGWCCDVARIDPEAPPFWRRHGVWLLAIAIVAYVPMLGNYSLYDPWETHYGEVAREMLAREDWISFWWAQENWFWSKPALDFWLQGLSFLLLGVRYRPDEMLAGVADGLNPAPEWAARAPVILLTLVANYLLYKAVARFLGRRVGFVAGLALTLAPYWYLIAHQSMTDMPYAAPLTAALALLLIGLDLSPRATVASIGVRVGRRELWFGKHHAVLLLVVASAIPQIAYLLSRHVSWSLAGASHFLRVHADQFMAGSGGDNCGLPGNDPCEASAAVLPELPPGLMALLWIAALAAFLWLNREESRAQRWAFLAGWYFVAVSALGQGAPGLVLPVVVVVTALFALRRLRDLERLEWGGFLLIVACVTLPWYVQAFARHGTGFTDRLLFYDMYKRAFVHVHDTNAGDDVSFRYYIWQLGYGLFPFTGVALWGFLKSFAVRPKAEAKTRDVLVFLGIWSLLGFAMFSVSLTKFHHYALPVAPPAAVLAGVALHEFVGDARTENVRQAVVRYGAAAAAAALALAATVWLTQGSWFGVRTEPNVLRAALGSPAFIAAVACFAVSVRFGGPLAASAPVN